MKVFIVNVQSHPAFVFSFYQQVNYEYDLIFPNLNEVKVPVKTSIFPSLQMVVARPGYFSLNRVDQREPSALQLALSDHLYPSLVFITSTLVPSFHLTHLSQPGQIFGDGASRVEPRV